MRTESLGIIALYDPRTKEGLLVETGDDDRYFRLSARGNPLDENNHPLALRQELLIVRTGKEIPFNKDLLLGDELVRVLSDEDLLEPIQPEEEVVKKQLLVIDRTPVPPPTAEELAEKRRLALERGIPHRRW